MRTMRTKQWHCPDCPGTQRGYRTIIKKKEPSLQLIFKSTVRQPLFMHSDASAPRFHHFSIPAIALARSFFP